MELKHEYRFLRDETGDLLIVPYGIETYIRFGSRKSPVTFNRTLWN